MRDVIMMMHMSAFVKDKALTDMWQLILHPVVPDWAVVAANTAKPLICELQCSLS